MNKKMIFSLISVLAIMSMLLTACAPAAPAATEAPAAPAATEAPAAPAATEAPAAPAATEAPAAPAATEPPAAPAADDKVGGRLVFNETDGYYMMDPFVTPWHDTQHYAVFDTLLTLKPDLSTYVGLLVEDGWDISDDGLTITFKVRDGLKYTDGTPVTSQTIKWVYDKHLDPTLASPGGGDIRDNFEEVQAPDDSTLVIKLKAPYAPLYSVLASTEMPSPTAYEELGPDKFGTAPVGSGPWIVKEVVPDVSVLYVRNPDYKHSLDFFENKGAVYPDEFLIRFSSDEAVNYAALEAGEVAVGGIPPQFLEKARANENIEIVEGGDTGETYIGFNTMFPPFDNRNVRVAISYAINRDELVEVGYEGEAYAVYTNLSPFEMGYSPEMEEYGKSVSNDVEMCKSMLEAEGYTLGSDNIYAKDGKKLDFTLTTTPDEVRGRLAQAVQAQLLDCGVNVKIDIKESAVVMAMTTAEPAGEYEMMIWGFGLLDPSILTYLYSSARLGASNRTRYVDPELDKLLLAADQAMDWEVRKQKVADVLKYLIDVRNMIPLTTPKTYTGYRKDKIADLKFDALGGWLYQDAYLLDK